MNTVVLVKLPKIPLLANKKSQTVQGISSLSQVMGLAAYKLRPVIGSVHGLTLVPKLQTRLNVSTAHGIKQLPLSAYRYFDPPWSPSSDFSAKDSVCQIYIIVLLKAGFLSCRYSCFFFLQNLPIQSSSQHSGIPLPLGTTILPLRRGCIQSHYCHIKSDGRYLRD